MGKLRSLSNLPSVYGDQGISLLSMVEYLTESNIDSSTTTDPTVAQMSAVNTVLEHIPDWRRRMYDSLARKMSIIRDE